jgi:hypothetical protein
MLFAGSVSRSKTPVAILQKTKAHFVILQHGLAPGLDKFAVTHMMQLQSTLAFLLEISNRNQPIIINRTSGQETRLVQSCDHAFCFSMPVI